MRGAFTVDLETDWGGRELPEARHVSAVHEAAPRLLELFERLSVQATFFVSGEIVPLVRDQLSQIAGHGHEIASHGYSHRSTRLLSPADFARDAERARKTIEDAVGQPVHGFRTPQFKLNPTHFEGLASAGYGYDSSVLLPAGTPEVVSVRATHAGKGLLEIGLARTPVLPLPPGLLWMQLIGPGLTARLLARSRSSVQVLYLHPFDLVLHPPRLRHGIAPNLWYCRGNKSLYGLLSGMVSFYKNAGGTVLLREVHDEWAGRA